MREQLQADVQKSKGRRVDQPAAYTVDIWFQSTPTWGDAGGKPSAFSCIRAMKNGIDLAIDQGISIHPPREGWDRVRGTEAVDHVNFNPPTPRGVGRAASRNWEATLRISIHPPREGWDPDDHRLPDRRTISIHPPREGWDVYAETYNRKQHYFNPPTPRGVGHQSARGCLVPQRDFNPPTPRGVGQDPLDGSACLLSISIHPPREGWDGNLCLTFRGTSYFNPPTPRGVGRPPQEPSRYRSHFNPPTPRGVGRLLALCQRRFSQFQSTHPARGGTRQTGNKNSAILLFQSTHPARGGTTYPAQERQPDIISIHPPREGWDTPLAMMQYH